MIPFEKGRFIASGLTADEFPNLKSDQGKPLPEIAFVGRSNVGKSTLINTLLRDKKLAKTSSTPGKTQRINFFIIDEKLLLVDLPGYGYSKAAKKEVSSWSQSIENYLQTRQTLKLLLLLVDSRREPSAEDLAMAEWVQAKQIPLVVIFTKSDKLLPSKIKEIEKQNRAHFSPAIDCLLFSNQDPGARRNLIQLLNRKL